MILYVFHIEKSSFDCINNKYILLLSMGKRAILLGKAKNTETIKQKIPGVNTIITQRGKEQKKHNFNIW